MLIHFVHAGNAYLPELHAYMLFIQSTGNQALIHRQFCTVPKDAAIVWWMCGLVDFKMRSLFPSAFHIHEYASASVGKLSHTRDLYKRWMQPRPDYRIFQNEWVRARLGFDDSLPYEFRDMGISYEFFSHDIPKSAPSFDFVYLGEMQRLTHFLPVFAGLAMARRKVLLIGELAIGLARYFKNQPNVTTLGKVAHTEVATHLNQARWGLNLVPNLLPYTEQTSTKLLEYCAAGLDVVSTDYPWVRKFEQLQEASFSYLPFQQDAETYFKFFECIHEQPHLPKPNLKALIWLKVLERMEIWNRLGIV